MLLELENKGKNSHGRSVPITQNSYFFHSFYTSYVLHLKRTLTTLVFVYFQASLLEVIEWP